MRSPFFPAMAGDINDRDLAGVLRNFPAGHSWTKIYVRNKSADRRFLSVQHLNGSFAGSGEDDFESTLFQRALHLELDKHLVFDDQNMWSVQASPNTTLLVTRISRGA